MSAKNTLAAKARRREKRAGKTRWQSHYLKTICRGCGHDRLMAISADRCCARCIRRVVIGLLPAGAA